jgi:pentatricopeptide repeat protein
VKAVTPELGGVVSALNEVLNLPSAERPYQMLVDAYLKEGMKEEAEAVLFLMKKRFGGKNDLHPDSDEEQRKDDRKDS